MDEKFFDMDDELFTLLTMTHKQLGVLEGMIKHIPDIKIISELMILIECHFSRLIDYDDGYFIELLKAINTGKREAKNILNIVSAYKYSFEKNVGEIDFSQLCTIAIYGHDSDKKIRERDKFSFLGQMRTNLKEYNPTAPDKIRSGLADISTFLSDNEKTDVLVKAALAHYQFEMIHPYDCYNGVIGRIMFPMILHSYGIRAAPYIRLSEYLYYRKNDYFAILGSTQYSGGYIALIKFFVRGIYESAMEAINKIDQLHQIIIEDEHKIVELGSSAKKLMAVYNYFKVHSLSQIRIISNVLEISFNTAAKSVNMLCELGILQLENNQSRHRVYVYDKILRILANYKTD
ncbi:MAG: Fic family protein [Firmicutes bacterium]|nr:Fic family protein [Bacillota bacterium]